MKKLLSYFIFFFLFFNIEGNSDEIYPVKDNIEEVVIDIGTVKGQNDPLIIYSKDAKTKSEKTSAA